MTFSQRKAEAQIVSLVNLLNIESRNNSNLSQTQKIKEGELTTTLFNSFSVILISKAKM